MKSQIIVYPLKLEQRSLLLDATHARATGEEVIRGHDAKFVRL